MHCVSKNSVRNQELGVRSQESGVTELRTLNSKLAFIDTHCHLEMTEFDEDRDKVIQRARDAGIEAVITVGSDLKGNIGSLRLSEKYDFIYSSVGIHPHDAKDFTEEIYKQLKEWGTNPLTPFTKGGQGGLTRHSSLVTRH